MTAGEGAGVAAQHGRPHRRPAGATATGPPLPPPGPPASAEPQEQARPVRLLTEPAGGLPPVVTTQQALHEAVTALAGGTGPVAVDAERASGFRYGHRAFLVQLRREGAGTVLIDPVTCPDLSELDAALASAQAVLHAASQDLPCLADLGYRPREIFDTEVAAKLLGYPRVGLAALAESVLGIGLQKSHSAADWSTRPLPEAWLKYAALDVEVLVELRDALAAQLAGQGKSEWARQEFAAVLAAPPPPPRAEPWRRTSGIHGVRTRRGLAVVRELWQQRDEIARSRDISPTRILLDAAIVGAAQAMPSDAAQLTAIHGFTARHSRRYLSQWLRAIGRARALPEQALPAGSAAPGEGPPPAHRWHDRNPDAARRLTAARAVVAALADSRHLPAENLVPPDAVRRLAWEPPPNLTPEAVAAALAGRGARPWQAQLTAVPLARALARVEEKAPD